jgi:hypothetical protein
MLHVGLKEWRLYPLSRTCAMIPNIESIEQPLGFGILQLCNSSLTPRLSHSRNLSLPESLTPRISHFPENHKISIYNTPSTHAVNAHNGRTWCTLPAPSMLLMTLTYADIDWTQSESQPPHRLRPDRSPQGPIS